jgi:hypothetical protein
MNAKEKAQELVDNFLATEKEYKEYADYIQAKQCALICVDEMCRYLPTIKMRLPSYQDVNEYCREYWQEVRKEIEKL